MDARTLRLAIPLLTALSAACSSGQGVGNYYNVTVAGTDNQCTGNGADYTESYTYRLQVDSNDIILGVEDDIFATGRLEACTVTYTSIVWEDEVDEFLVRWKIIGEARVDIGGGSGCVGDGDWEGTESFEVVSSTHPDISAGCRYDLAVTGTWVEEIVE